MNIIIIKDRLKEGVDIALRASTSKKSLPVLQNVLIRAEKEKIYLITTNLEIAILYSLQGKIIEHGSYTVPIQLLSQLINSIKQDRITLTTKESFLEIITDNYHAKLQGSSSEDFPIIPKIKNDTEYISISSDIFQSALEKTIAASQYSELRQELNNILFLFSHNILTLVSTDSFRLAEKQIFDRYFSSNYNEEFQLLIPLKTSQELIKILPKEGEIKIYHDKNQISFVSDNWTLISRLTEGTFPDYKSIIPKEFNSSVVVKKQEIIDVIKITSIFGVRNQEITLKPGNQKKVIELSSRDDTLGENNSLVSAHVKKEFQETSFNWKYLLDGVRACEGEEITIGLNADNKPAIISSSKDASFFYLLMPIIRK